MKEVAYVGRREDFCRRFKVRIGQGIYIDEKSQTKCIYVGTEINALGRRFDDVVLISDGGRYYSIYDNIKETRLRDTN